MARRYYDPYFSLAGVGQCSYSCGTSQRRLEHCLAYAPANRLNWTTMPISFFSKTRGVEVGFFLPGRIGRNSGEFIMAYLVPAEFVAKMVDAGESKIFMSTRDTLIRAYMAGAILALSAVFAVTVTVQTGFAIIGAILFPVGFCMLYLLGFDLLTGVFVLTPLALIDKRPGVTIGGVLRNWGLVFTGNFLGAFTVAVLMAIVFTFGFTTEPDKVGQVIAGIGEKRTLGYAAHGAQGMLTLFVRGMLCNWMVSTGVVGAMISTSVSGKVIAMWMPIMLFFGMTFEHSVVNMFLFPSGLLLGGNYSLMDYLIWNEIPTVLGNLVGGLAFTGLTLYATHIKTAAKRVL
jgi:formate transporter